MQDALGVRQTSCPRVSPWFRFVFLLLFVAVPVLLFSFVIVFLLAVPVLIQRLVLSVLSAESVGLPKSV